MGGYAYIIPGTLSRERLAAASAPPPFLKRILGGPGLAGPRVTTLGGGDRLFEIDPGALRKHLVHDFRDLGYLELISPESDADAPGFGLDYATVSAHEEDPRLERLNELFGHYMKEGKCRCQLCEPDFGDARTGQSS